MTIPLVNTLIFQIIKQWEELSQNLILPIAFLIYPYLLRLFGKLNVRRKFNILS